MLTFLRKPAIWTVPLYQRTYNWTRSQCDQLWKDIERLDDNKNDSHFIGSIVFIESGPHLQTMLKPSIIIDGQQRLTTISLIILAISRIMSDRKYSKGITSDAVNDYFLFNNNEHGDKKYRLLLTKNDKNTYINMLEGRDPPENPSTSIIDNFQFFVNKIKSTKIDLYDLLTSLERLLIVEITLEIGKDNPQLIFESLNSTGLRLTQADLIRNYILMGLNSEKQEEVYNNYWQPMEELFREMERGQFDKFMRYFLHVQTRKERILIGNVYQEFKTYWENKNKNFDVAIKEIHKFAKYYADLIFNNFKNETIAIMAKNIKDLNADVVYPFLLEVTVDQKNGIITEVELIEIFKLVESYVFRRAICGIPTNSMNYTFAILAKDIKKEDYLNSLKYIFIKKEKQYRFPMDDDFKNELRIKDVYHFTRRHYLLTKLENHDTKEPIETKKYTVEHIVPQNPNLSQQWKDDLGNDLEEIQSKHLHTLGNLTLTGYNTELSDKSFHEKKNMKHGFLESPIRLNKKIADYEKWNKLAIIQRTSELTDLASIVWKYPKLNPTIFTKYEVEMKKESIENDEPISKSKFEPWHIRLSKADLEIQKLVKELLQNITNNFSCHGRSEGGWYYLYTDETEEEKFAVILIGRKTVNICFRIDPEVFTIDNPQIRCVKGFFWRHVERRSHVSFDNLDLIMDCVTHSYQTVKKFQAVDDL